MIRYERLKEEEVRKEYERRMKVKFASLRQEVGECEEEWKEFSE